MGLLDFAVNVYAGPRPDWLERALHDSLTDAAAYPDVAIAASAIAQHHNCTPEDVLPTAGASEAFSLIARLRRWRTPVVIHPQFSEPHAALEQAGHAVTTVLCTPANAFALDPDDVPEDADLVIIGNPTNPTGVLHPADLITGLQRNGRLIVVDEAFMDTVPGETESLVGEQHPGVLMVRSLTKQWSIPGIRAGYAIGHRSVIRQLIPEQTPWSVSTPAIAAMVACSTEQASIESHDRALTVARWRAYIEDELTARGIEFIPSATSFVLAHVGEGIHAALRGQGVAVRRSDTFPGLDGSWVRIAVRPPASTVQLFAALDRLDQLS